MTLQQEVLREYRACTLLELPIKIIDVAVSRISAI